MEETFKRKNDIGVEIEYSVIGTYKENGINYRIYTDFVTADNKIGIRLFVDKEQNGNFVRVPENIEKQIIINFNKEIMMKK